MIRCEEAYELYIKSPTGMIVALFDFCFDDSLPLFLDEYVDVEEGDIINMRTLIDLDFPPYSAGDKEIYDYYKKNSHIGNNYLATFLIELDPL